MKELSIQQKAKRYYDALERARALNNGEDVDDEAGTNTCEYIFPELKESADERIVKCLLNYFNNVRYNGLDLKGTDVDEVIAWLENSAKVSESSTEEKDMTEFKIGFECGKQRVLKYPEDFNLCEKSAWSEEDEKHLSWLIEYLGQSEGLYDNLIDWLKSLRPKKHK